MPALFFIVAAPGQGKTMALGEVVAALGARGLRVGGVRQVALDVAGVREGYALEEVSTGARFAFARRREKRHPGDLAYVFDPVGWSWAAERIVAARREADVLVVDEVGRLEAEGRGHLPALLAPVPGERAQVWILAVRDLALPAIEVALGEPRLAVAAPLSESDLAALVEACGPPPLTGT